MKIETLDEKIKRWEQAIVFESEVAEVVSAILLSSHKVSNKEIVR